MNFYQWGVIAAVCLSTQVGPARAASEPIEPFSRAAVRLTPSVWEKGQVQDAEYLLALEPDRLLHCFRVTAGLPAPGRSYEGWEDSKCDLRGHFSGGHYLSAVALMYASTGDGRFKERGDLMVSELAKCQNASGYLSAFPESFFERVENGRHVWAPYYTVHKVFAGLLDQYEWCGNQQALEMAKKLAVYFEKRNEAFDAEKMKSILRIEAGGFVESLWNLYDITHEERFKTFAEKFEKSVFLLPLMEGKDNLTRLHGNTHIPLVLGAMRRWELTGDRRYLELSKFFWECVVEKRGWATGGTTGPGENWGEPGKLAEIMSLTSHETCKTHNMLRLSRKLFEATGDHRYADYIAHAHLNGILGTQGPEAGQFEYYVPQATGYHRWYGYPDKSMWCCYGTGIESFAKLGDSVFFHQGDTLYINQFIPCVLDWKEKKFQLAIETKYPMEESVEFVVKAADGGKRTLRILQPSWASRGVDVRINGRELKPKVEGGFIELSEAWMSGDKITVKVPMSLRAIPLPDDPQQVAIAYGPVVLAGMLETPAEKAFMTQHAGAGQPQFEKKRKVYYFNAARPDDLSWLKPVPNKPMHFSAEGQPFHIEFKPFFMVTSEVYGLYWPILEKDGARQQALDKQNRALALLARTEDGKAVGALDALEKEYAGLISDADVAPQHYRLRVAMARAFKAAGQAGKVAEVLKPLTTPFISSQPKFADVLDLMGGEAETTGIRPLVLDENEPNGDGAGVRATLDGVPVVKTIDSQLRFIYFSFIPKARAAMTGKDVRITVKYRANADLLMHYSAVDNAYSHLKQVKVETDGGWKIATFECVKAQFGGRQNGNSDLRLFAADNSILTIADVQATPTESPLRFAAELFDLGDVRLLDSAFKQAQETDLAYLLNLDPNRLLSFLQKQAGLFAGSDPLLGWKNAKIGAEGADWSLGHYLSACAQMYRATRDPRMLERVNRIVDELAACQKAEGNAGLLASPGQKRAFEEVRNGTIRANGGTLNGTFVPFYGKHIVLTGLLDAYHLCGNAKAREVLVTMTDWYGEVLKNLTEEQMQQVLLTEHGGMPEALANVYAVTGEPRHLALAKRFRHDEFFKPILAGEDMLSTHHANTQVPKFSGYQRIHELTGEEEWGRAAANFWTFVAKNRSFANGGNCVREHFNPLDQFDLAMKETQGPETCNSYNMLNLTRHLFAEKAEAGYMDFYERVLYNQILPSQHPKTGGFVYNTPLVPGAFRVYMDVTNQIGWCCVGTGMENHALYGAAIYAHQADKLFVNLFIPSELTWREQGATVTQATAFPDEPRTALKMKLAAPAKFTVALRVPGWLEPGALRLAVNGEAVAASAGPGAFAEVTREWKDGDALTAELPMKLHTEMLPNTNTYVAVFYGPLLLAAKLGSEGLVEGDFHSGTSMPAKDKLPAAQIPVIVRPVSEIAEHIAQVKGEPLVFSTRDLCKPADVTLVPISRIYDERYSIYFPLMTAAKWEEAKRQWAVEEQRERELLRRTVDEIRCGEQQPEMDHRIKSERSKNAWNTAAGRAFREAVNGWFSYEMTVDGQSPMTLSCTYWGSDKGPREFDILVDRTVVATQAVDELKLGEFVEVAYPIPESLTRGKDEVTVTFQAKKNKIAGGVYGCRMLNMTPDIEDAAKAAKDAAAARAARAAAAERSAALTKSATASASVTNSPAGNFKIAAVNDGIDPESSIDTRAKAWHTWPNPGKAFWLQYDFPAPVRVSAVRVYWFDETATRASCRVPASWKLLAKADGQWREVENPSGYGVERDKYNRTAFKPIQAEGLRIEAKSQAGWSSGVIEWRVE